MNYVIFWFSLIIVFFYLGIDEELVSCLDAVHPLGYPDLNSLRKKRKRKWASILRKLSRLMKSNDSSTIDGNVEFVHSQYSCILTPLLSIQFLCPTKLLIIVIVLE